MAFASLPPCTRRYTSETHCREKRRPGRRVHIGIPASALIHKRALMGARAATKARRCRFGPSIFRPPRPRAPTQILYSLYVCREPTKTVAGRARWSFSKLAPAGSIVLCIARFSFPLCLSLSIPLRNSNVSRFLLHLPTRVTCRCADDAAPRDKSLLLLQPRRNEKETEEFLFLFRPARFLVSVQRARARMADCLVRQRLLNTLAELEMPSS